jgi:Zn-dependent protease
VRSGYLTLGAWRGAPIRLHWTLPLGALLFGGFHYVPGFWVGFFLVVFIHEMGHAVLVRRYRGAVVSIDIHGLGGVCRWQGAPSAIERAKIAWGGVLAQLVSYGLAIGALAVFGQPQTAFTFQLASAFLIANLWLIVINLIPVPPLDGAEAWPLLGLWFRRWRSARHAVRSRRAHDLESARRSVERELAALEREPSRRTKTAVDELLRKIQREPGSRDN